MKWLLIIVWLSGGAVEVTTERFETQAECEATGVILAEWSQIEGGRHWNCYEMKGPTL